jgi:CBS domain-containing membrane protein
MAQKRTTAQLMSANPITITPRLSVGGARALLKRHDIKALPIVNADKTLMGLFVDGPYDARTKVSEVMREKAVTLAADAPAEALIPLLAVPGQRHIVITDAADKVAGIVTRSDLMRALLHTAR